MSMSSTIAGPRRVQVWQADAEWPDDTYVVPAEDHDVVTADRDIKAANLQLLVQAVLDYDELDVHGDTPAEEFILRYSKLVDLARGLKQ